jgi:hypothetical protein
MTYSVVAKGIEPLSEASETSILSVELRDHITFRKIISLNTYAQLNPRLFVDLIKKINFVWLF